MHTCAVYLPGRALLWTDLAGVTPSTATTGKGGLQSPLGAGRGTLSTVAGSGASRRSHLGVRG